MKIKAHLKVSGFLNTIINICASKSISIGTETQISTQLHWILLSDTDALMCTNLACKGNLKILYTFQKDASIILTFNYFSNFFLIYK